MNATKFACLTGATALALAAAGAARADDTPPAAAPAAPAGPTALSSPSMSSSLAAPSDPLNIDLGPAGKIYVSGQATLFAAAETAAPTSSQKKKGDVSNLQIEVQKTDGVFQFYVQAGEYNLPSLGTPMLTTTRLTEDTFRYVPTAYIKIVPNAAFNVEVGILPTLIGAEYTFSFQNLNIERGLLWNQEPAISRGVQANYTQGPLAVSVSINDGYYSDHYSTVSGLATYTLSPKDTLAVAASGNFDKTSRSSFVTPVAQNNGTIWNVIYTHTEGNWVLNPYIQYSTTPKDNAFGLPSSASTFGAAVLAKYQFNPLFNLAGRVEYISSSGSQVALLYGTKSDAWSFTLTPTLQVKQYFVRGEFSYTKIGSGTPGSEFGKFANKSDQSRAMIETGVLF
ncbi:outer membrane beta-barrel protein [Phenylobacterium sp.]|uniref:outer membrane beta-barrel protein n=1 Tax=Phenylobacterium sp. TaxID=1871053 RepID=UPI002D041884|nr:outer membrane beta-barrel protein [Phenylobacterium sp.]HLZ75504.1 outer membrane beta-barrel protein [Phenylobacterium sp.]